MVGWHWIKMSQVNLEDIPTIPSEYPPDLEWSMRPMFLLMQMFGIPTFPHRSSSHFRRYTLLCAGFIIMIFILTFNMQLVYDWTSSNHKEGWITSLHKFYPPLTNIVITFNLIASAHMQWTSMWKIAIEIENSIRFDATFYHSLRKIAIAVWLMLIVVNNC